MIYNIYLTHFIFIILLLLFSFVTDLLIILATIVTLGYGK